MPKVQAKCILFAWDSVACRSYEPGKGPLEDGLYEIDTESHLANLTTGKHGDFVFQWDGHESKAMKAPEPIKAPVDKRYKPMSAEHKKKMADARAAKMAKRAELAAA